MFHAVIRSRQVLGERRTFVYHNPSPCEIVYYLGQNITIVRDEPLKEIVQDVTFVCYDDRESAIRASNLFFDNDVCHSRVLLSRGGYGYDAGLNKHLVCFDRFDGFLPHADQTFLASLQDPNSSSKVPGNPNEVVQNEIKELSAALNAMHAEGVSSSLLHLPIGYVWCPPQNSWSHGKLKIILLDFNVERDHTSVQWNNILARDVKRFGIGLDKYFLNTTVDWPEKNSFLRCFSIRLQDESRRLPMIHRHPFLKGHIYDILYILTMLHLALRSTNHGPFQLTKLMAALNNKQFKSEFMPNGEWTRQEMSPEFQEFLRGEPRGNSYKYNTNDMGDLVRFLQNVFANGNENGLRLDFLDFFFNEVGRYWAHLIDRLHEKVTMLEGISSLY